MPKLCTICKNKTAYIHMEEGSYCYNCHSIWLKNKIGLENDSEFSYNARVDEESGLSHEFNISRTVRDELVTLDAIELESGYYLFEVDSNINDDCYVAFQELFKKLFYGINHKQIDKSIFGHNIASKGYIRIIEDEENDWNTAFVVDGEKLSPYELMQCFGYANGFTIQYRVVENSDPLIGENDYLTQIRITSGVLIDELTNVINVYFDNGYFDKTRVKLFDEYFMQFIKKLKILYIHNKNEAIMAGEKMIELLRGVEKEYLSSLESDIITINKIIHKE